MRPRSGATPAMAEAIVPRVRRSPWRARELRRSASARASSEQARRPSWGSQGDWNSQRSWHRPCLIRRSTTHSKVAVSSYSTMRWASVSVRSSRADRPDA